MHAEALISNFLILSSQSFPECEGKKSFYIGSVPGKRAFAVQKEKKTLVCQCTLKSTLMVILESPVNLTFMFLV